MGSQRDDVAAASSADLVRPRWDIALDVVVWSVQNDYPDTDRVPASLAHNEAELEVLATLEPWELLQMFALFYAIAAEHFEANGWDEEAVQQVARLGHFAEMKSQRLERYERDKPVRVHVRGHRRRRSRRTRSRRHAVRGSPSSSDDSEPPPVSQPARTAAVLSRLRAHVERRQRRRFKHYRGVVA